MTPEVRMVSLKGRIYHIHGHDQSYISAAQSWITKRSIIRAQIKLVVQTDGEHYK